MAHWQSVRNRFNITIVDDDPVTATGSSGGSGGSTGSAGSGGGGSLSWVTLLALLGLLRVRSPVSCSERVGWQRSDSALRPARPARTPDGFTHRAFGFKDGSRRGLNVSRELSI
jgi:hypothetical protein